MRDMLSFNQGLAVNAEGEPVNNLWIFLTEEEYINITEQFPTLKISF